ncbi:MAG: NUDIX domain-containing protein [Candidatus Babeliaceae bacterium]|jgi:8-oxo-dGTP pyrophosphatase MutT (NUDIX family)
MKQEISAGAVVYYVQPETHVIEYLILHYNAGHWDFPKGKIEANETPRQAAVREVKEETGLQVVLDDVFEQSLTYLFKDKEGVTINKTVTLYLAKVDTEVVTLSSEHIYYKWLIFEDALKLLSFQNARQIIQMADRYIHANKSSEHHS